MRFDGDVPVHALRNNDASRQNTTAIKEPNSKMAVAVGGKTKMKTEWLSPGTRFFAFPPLEA